MLAFKTFVKVSTNTSTP